MAKQIKVREDNYFAVQGWMVTELKLKGNISKVKYYEAKRAAEICNDAYTHALGEYHVANLRELKQERAKEFEDYLQILTESMLGL